MDVQQYKLKTVENGNATIGYFVVGPRNPMAPTLCIIASTGRGPEDFVHLAEHLASFGVRVVLPWPRGIGPSIGLLDGINFHDLASDAAAVLKAEAREGGAFIAGHAYGCWIARTVAQNYQNFIDGLVLLAAGGGKWPAELSQAIDVAMDPNEPEEKRLAALQLGFFAEGNNPQDWLKGWHGELVVAQRRARARTDRDSWWPSGTVPILDIIGLQDPFRPADARNFYMIEFAPRVELQTVEGASHAMPDEKPAEVAALLVTWLKTRFGSLET